jgi:glycosyltransferase involved in cell wall biosynthesis
MSSGTGPLLSVITVVFNDEKNIRRTMRSVTGQTYPNIEYIIVDGGSTDGTLNAIDEWKEKVSLLIPGPDKGIYDAMNKGLARASGDYVAFMNSGDEFYSGDTIERLFSTAPDADIYYGETEMIGPGLESLGRRRHRAPRQLRHSSFRFGMSVSHQAIVIRRAITESFDTKYRLSADIDWILRAIRKAHTIVNTHQYVARYLVGGMSKQWHFESLKERFHIFSKHYGLIPNLFNHLVITLRLAGDRLRPGGKRLKT